MFPNKQIIQNIISCSCCILYSVRTFNRLITFNPTCTYILFNIISSYHTKIFLALVSINHLNFVNTPSLPSFFSSPLFRKHTLLFFSFSYFLWKIFASTGLVLVYLGHLFCNISLSSLAITICFVCFCSLVLAKSFRQQSPSKLLLLSSLSDKSKRHSARILRSHQVPVPVPS